MSQRAFPSSEICGAFRPVPRTGVIYVMTEAKRLGYQAFAPDWVNFGQGQPETGPLPGAPTRISSIPLDTESTEYGPVGGIDALREAVASYYNRTYRKGLKSQYTAENVAIAPGGRAGLTRVIAALGSLNLGHFLPDYTAYEELLGTFKNFNPIPIMLEPERGYAFSPKELQQEILGRGLSALLLSNPCNPTGKLICGEELAAWVSISRKLDCTLILDEFYSRYIWPSPQLAPVTHEGQVSAAAYVEDVDRDPTIIIDGLTKNWRYPGLRLSWVLGPKKAIDAVASTGSFLDGGACHPLQQAAIPLLSAEHCQAETLAIQQAFAPKRQLLLRGLRELGISTEGQAQGTFYVWGNLSALPEPLNEGMSFFQKALEQKVITVPGEFFDVNPGRRRYGRPSRFRHHARFSFGPDSAMIAQGLEKLKHLIRG